MLLKFSKGEHKMNFRACQPNIIFTHTHTQLLCEVSTSDWSTFLET